MKLVILTLVLCCPSWVVAHNRPWDEIGMPITVDFDAGNILVWGACLGAALEQAVSNHLDVVVDPALPRFVYTGDSTNHAFLDLVRTNVVGRLKAGLNGQDPYLGLGIKQPQSRLTEVSFHDIQHFMNDCFSCNVSLLKDRVLIRIFPPVLEIRCYRIRNRQKDVNRISAAYLDSGDDVLKGMLCYDYQYSTNILKETENRFIFVVAMPQVHSSAEKYLKSVQ